MRLREKVAGSQLVLKWKVGLQTLQSNKEDKRGGEREEQFSFLFFFKILQFNFDDV